MRTLGIFRRLAWEPGWKQTQAPAAQVDLNSLLEKAKKLENEADTKEKVRELIKTYESVLAIEPENRMALARLGNCYFLMGYGYDLNADDKASDCIKSIQYSERLLYLNKDFKSKVDNGAKLWEALDALTRDDLTALIWWYLSLCNYYKECFNAVERLLNIYWGKRVKMILARMMAIDPSSEHGMPYYLWGCYYSSAPAIAGGNLQKADSMFKKAIEAGPIMLNFRRTRARLLHTKTGDREAFIRDMDWVLSQDPHQAPLGYPLNAFIQRDAKQGLAEIEKYF